MQLSVMQYRIVVAIAALLMFCGIAMAILKVYSCLAMVLMFGGAAVAVYISLRRGLEGLRK
jgi:hypothetical protein